MKTILLLSIVCLVVFALPANAENPNALYVTYDSVNLQDLTIYNELIQKGFTVTKSVDTIPENMEEYDLVVVNTYTAPWQGTADYMKNYIANGGGAVILGGVPAMFPYPYPHGYTTQGYYNISYISDWFGSSRYANTGGTARITMDNPLGTTYYSGDILISGVGYASAAVTNLHPDDTQILARWDTGPVFAFTHTYGNGRVFYLAGSGYPAIDELYLAGALWAANVPLNIPPIADPNGPYTTDEGTPITFDASGSSDLDAGDSIVLYEWDLDNDGEFDDATGVNPIATWNDDYSGTVTLRVTDTNGETDTASTSLTVNNVAPTANLDNNGPKDESSVVTVLFTDQDDPGTSDTFTYSFDWDNDGTYDIEDQVGASAEYTWYDEGTYTVKGRIKDNDGGSTEYTTDVTVNNVAPTATIGNNNPQDEGSAVTVSFTDQDDPGTSDTFTYSFDWDNDGMYDIEDQEGASAEYTWYDEGTYTVKGRIKDNDGGSTEYTTDVTVNNVAPTVESLTIPTYPVQVNSEISVEGSFSDPGIDDTHIAVWDWDDGTTSEGTVGTGMVSGQHTYDQAGIYTVTLTVTDDDSGIGMLVSTTYIVVYDPSGAFVTGGGWINSPEGAYPSDTTFTGKTSFGFVSKYKKGATIPTGQTEFHSKGADLNFHSSSYDWLVIANAKAICKGEGTINGEVRDNGEPYKFLLSSIDADINENEAHSDDKFWIKIYYEDNTGEVVVYDNLIPGTDDADPTTEIQGGSIVIHKR